MNKMKYTIWGQMLSILKTHAVTGVVVFLLWFAIASMWAAELGNKFFGIFGTLCYIVAIYNCASNCAITDRKKISPLTPHPGKGLILPVFLLIANLIIIAIYRYAWAAGGDGQYLREVWAVILNGISLIWVSPYNAFLGMAHGHMELKGYLIICFLPFIISAIGYFAGYCGFDLYEKISSFAYEKEK